MAARSTAPEKRPGFFSQLKTLYKFTREAYSWLPTVLICILIVGVALGVAVGFLLPPFAIWSVVLWGITGLLAGVLGSMITMTRLSTRAMYRRIDGMPGAAGQVLSTSLGRKWRGNDMPVGINPKTQEAVYRAVGRGGVVIVGEGARGRLTRLINEERSKVKRVASGVPVTVIYVGHADDEVPIAKLAKTVKALPTKIDRSTMSAVIKRIDSVSQSVASLPIPKGIDPSRARAPRPR
ncbi:hypothetical protein FHX49_002553 [Microbacterium endophyticum]|uniref:DUF4191 domain-containing protein n=1 Tax=Microbacterium endophyticum TaxID=1526412 RepID=A0A7W4YPN6_9MICO|nr:DUF4191 family protein [Microbacterium endophyticum]MBB2976961.1 hypothetical protein [Microbacterium endophyticum]NIK36753.1 hypothetical protein [Microbacterium endophyticum]